MAFDYIDIGASPCMEDCAQVGSPDYTIQSRRETQAYKQQLMRAFPEPDGAAIVIRYHRHDFGTYAEVAVRYEEGDEEATSYAYMVENEAPEHWDAIAKAELGLA